MANWTSREELERKISRRRVLELFDDDGDGHLTGEDATTLDETVASANDEVTSILFRKGFDAAALNVLSSDAALRRYATAILAGYAGSRKLEFHDANGQGPYAGEAKIARTTLKEMASGEIRSRLEALGAGENPIVGGDTNLGDPVFVVSRDPRYPGTSGPGGF